MSVIRKIILFAVPLFISFFKGQITDDSVKAVNQLYAQYFTSDVLAMSFNNKWAVVSDKNSYGLERAHLVQLQTGRSEEIPLSYRTYFFGDDLLIIQDNDLTTVKILKSGNTAELNGNYRYEAFEKESKLLFFDRLKKELLFFDHSGNKIRSYEDIESIGISNNKPCVVFRSSQLTFKLDLKTLDLTRWKSKGKVLWQSLVNEDVLSLESDGKDYQVARYGRSSNVNSQTIHIASGFHLDSLSATKMALKDERYLILPVVRATIRPKDQRSIILYTNQSSYYKIPMSQMAVYDIAGQNWKRFPQHSDFFTVQVLLDDHGTIMSYDPSLDKIENESNVHHQMKIERNFGESKINIDNSHERKSNYHYDSQTGRMLYFQDKRWRIENTNSGAVSEIPFEKPSNFISWVYNGLSDYASGNAYPTNRRGIWIISDGYDLYMVDIMKVSVERLTFGREKYISYTITENFRTKYLRDSYWDTSRSQEINMDKKLILKSFDSKDYTSGLAELDIASSKIKALLKLNDIVQEVFVSDNSIAFTAHSYNQPLSIYALGKNAPLKLLYRSKGKDGAEPPILKKEIIHYEVKGEHYNAALLYPLNYREGVRYPVIFNIYERKSKDITSNMLPSLHNNQGFDPMHYVYQDYFVLLPDLAYETGRAGHSISQSVQELVKVLDRNRSVDLDRMAVTGVSFGGYESFYLMAKGKWFKTGFAGVGISDLPSNAMGFTKSTGVPNYFKDERQQARMERSLFDNYHGYLENSPIYHLRSMKQPILIWLGQKDGNVNPDQSRMFFVGLKRLGKKGVLLEYPNEGHTVKHMDNQLDLSVKGWQWMEYHLKGKPAADWIKPILE